MIEWIENHETAMTVFAVLLFLTALLGILAHFLKKALSKKTSHEKAYDEHSKKKEDGKHDKHDDKHDGEHKHAEPKPEPVWKKSVSKLIGAAIAVVAILVAVYYWQSAKAGGEKFAREIFPSQYEHQAPFYPSVPKVQQRRVTDTSFELTKPFTIYVDQKDALFSWDVTAEKDSVRIDNVWYQDDPTKNIAAIGPHVYEFRPCHGIPARLHFRRIRVQD